MDERNEQGVHDAIRHFYRLNTLLSEHRTGETTLTSAIKDDLGLFDIIYTVSVGELPPNVRLEILAAGGDFVRALKEVVEQHDPDDEAGG